MESMRRKSAFIRTSQITKKKINHAKENLMELGLSRREANSIIDREIEMLSDTLKKIDGKKAKDKLDCMFVI